MRSLPARWLLPALLLLLCLTGCQTMTAGAGGVAGRASGPHTYPSSYNLAGPSTTDPCDERMPF